MRVYNLTRNVLLAESVSEAKTFGARLLGWLNRDRPAPGEGIYLTPCVWVHTLGLSFALDVIYLDPQGTVLARHTLEPGRVGPRIPKAQGVLELPAGQVPKEACQPGDHLQLLGREKPRGPAAADQA